MRRVLKPLKLILVVLGVVLVVLELPPPSSSFTEASEVWVRVAWMPLKRCPKETHRGPA